MKTKSIARAKPTKKSKIANSKVRIAYFFPDFLYFIVQTLYFDNSIKIYYCIIGIDLLFDVL